MSRTNAKQYLKIGTRLAGLALVVTAGFFLAPQRFGGSMSYSITAGNSMEPMFSRGDIAVVRKSDRYAQGDVVAYQSKHLGRIVLHRIVGKQDGHFVMKGDNNTWIDSDTPVESDVVGKLWVRVPGLGRVLTKFQDPRQGAFLMGGLAAMILGLQSLWPKGRKSAAVSGDEAPAPVCGGDSRAFT